MSRNAIFNALLAFASQIRPPSGTEWGEIGRKTKLPDGVQFPALIQVEGDCDYTSSLGQLRKRKEQVTLLVYHNTGGDQAVDPAVATQDFKDRVDAQFGDEGVRLETLGGLAFAVWIEGAIRRYPGDLDGIELITIPLSIILLGGTVANAILAEDGSVILAEDGSAILTE